MVTCLLVIAATKATSRRNRNRTRVLEPFHFLFRNVAEIAQADAAKSVLAYVSGRVANRRIDLKRASFRPSALSLIVIYNVGNKAASRHGRASCGGAFRHVDGG